MKLISILALGLFILPTSTTFGAPQGGRNVRGPGGPLLNAPIERLTDRLALDSDQVERLQKVRADYRTLTAEHRAAVETTRAQMRKLWRGPAVPKKAEVLRLQATMRAHRMPMMDAMIDARIAAMEVLTVEQRTELGNLGRGQGRGRKKMRGQGQGRGRSPDPSDS